MDLFHAHHDSFPGVFPASNRRTATAEPPGRRTNTSEARRRCCGLFFTLRAALREHWLPDLLGTRAGATAGMGQFPWDLLERSRMRSIHTTNMDDIPYQESAQLECDDDADSGPWRFPLCVFSLLAGRLARLEFLDGLLRYRCVSGLPAGHGYSFLDAGPQTEAGTSRSTRGTH